DPVEMVLVEGMRELGVEGAVAGELVAEGFLDHQSGRRRQHTARLQALADRAEEAGLKREVKRAHPIFPSLEDRRQRIPALSRGHIDPRIADAPDETPQAGLLDVGGRDEAQRGRASGIWPPGAR